MKQENGAEDWRQHDAYGAEGRSRKGEAAARTYHRAEARAGVRKAAADTSLFSSPGWGCVPPPADDPPPSS